MSQAAEDGDSVPQDPATNPGGDVEMVEGTEGAEDDGEGGGNNENGGDLPFADADIVEPRTTFLSYLMSPVVTLLVGEGEEQVVLSAHQALLAQSPFFDEATKSFVEDGSVCFPCQLVGLFVFATILTKLLLRFSHDRSSLRTKTKRPSGPFSNTSTPVNISLRSCPANGFSKKTARPRRSTIQATSFSSTRGYTHWPTSSA